MRLSLVLPREAVGVPVIRRVLGGVLHGLGVSEECTADILVAASEACTNAVRHADAASDYEVVVGIDGDHCVLKVTDRGRGFEASSSRRAHPDAESGRGIGIMHELVDDVDFDVDPAGGTVVYLHKRLVWRADAPLVHVEQPLASAGG